MSHPSGAEALSLLHFSSATYCPVLSLDPLLHRGAEPVRPLTLATLPTHR
jgi:hypothetical protein